MPFNSFENYPLTWKPEKAEIKPPLYLGLAQKLEHDILTGAIASGTKMPPQRELADYLDISLNTVTRAYTLCIKKGLLRAVTGNGTFVSETAQRDHSVVKSETPIPKAIDLSIAAPACTDAAPILAIMKRTLDSPEISDFFRYTHPLGTEPQRRSALQWLEQFGIHATPENVLIANGTQNALNMVLSSLFNDGDKIAVDQYTYANFIGLANMLHITLIPVKSDENGMSAEELSKLLRSATIKGLYVSPSCSNPQAICMPLERRRELAHLIKEHGIKLIEDDCYAFLLEQQIPSISSLVPEHSLYLSGMNKAIAPGLRIAFLRYPTAFKEQLETAVYNCNLIVSPLNAEFAHQFIQSGFYLENIKKQRLLAVQRSSIFKKYFPLANPHSYYQWLPLPDGISGLLFETLAAKEGILVYGSERFLAGASDDQHFIRISTMAAQTEQDLETAFKKIRGILSELAPSKTPLKYTL